MIPWGLGDQMKTVILHMTTCTFVDIDTYVLSQIPQIRENSKHKAERERKDKYKEMKKTGDGHEL